VDHGFEKGRHLWQSRVRLLTAKNLTVLFRPMSADHTTFVASECASFGGSAAVVSSPASILVVKKSVLARLVIWPSGEQRERG
jgi:hypothetical protein